MALSYPHLTPLTERIIGMAIEVHRELGPGLLESSYEEGLAIELHEAGLPFLRQHPIPIRYKQHALSVSYRADMIVDSSVLIEVKAVEKVIAVHDAQVITYLRMSGLHIGLLFNFNSVVLINGMKRFVI